MKKVSRQQRGNEKLPSIQSFNANIKILDIVDFYLAKWFKDFDELSFDTLNYLKVIGLRILFKLMDLKHSTRLLNGVYVILFLYSTSCVKNKYLLDKLNCRERSGSVVECFNSRQMGSGFEPHQRHCVVSLSQTHLS